MYNQQANQAETEQQFYGDPRGRGYGCGHGGRHRGWGRGRHGWPFGGVQLVPVNIEDTASSYVLSLFAAGLNKEKIELTVKDDVLTVAYQGTDQQPGAASPTGSNYTRREFRNASFERSFQLNGKVLVADITAQYADGILTVNLPKNPATNQPAQAISVS